MATGFTKNFVVKNGITTGSITLDAASGNIDGGNVTLTGDLSVTGISTLGNIGNVKITGGSNGQSIITDGNGNLSFANASSQSSPAPMPIVIDEGNTLTISANYQGLFGYPLTIDGTLIGGSSGVDDVTINVTGTSGQPFVHLGLSCTIFLDNSFSEQLYYIDTLGALTVIVITD